MTDLRSISLEEKYEAVEGRVLLSGPQALTRLPMIQHLHDQAAGHRTGGFISGYQGSPITTYDLNLIRNRALLDAHNIVFQPAVNEELAATACWGSQQLDNFQHSDTDGVFGLWYGKGPGVDRASDALKHGNHAGTHPLGGVLAVFGDDHAAKSSTVAHNSEPVMASASIPVLYPAGVDEYIDYGLVGWAMSRFTGLWSGFKAVNETIEQTATVDIDVRQSRIVIPEGGVFPPEGVHYNSAYTPARDDILVTRFKLPLVHLFWRANRLDREEMARSGKRRLGIVAAGKSYQDVRQGLMMLGIDDDAAAALGLNIYKLGLIWPVEPEGLRAFADGHEELLVIEEKKPFLEPQIASLLYNEPRRPRLIGKRDEQGRELFPSDAPLDAVLVADVIGKRLQKMGLGSETLSRQMQDLGARLAQQDAEPAPYARTAFYCSGCPHNTSTNLPEGSQGMGGIGCHGMATFTRTDTLGVTQMGGEGATWIGAAPFVDTNHVFQNLGDGTYYHSGLLAIRAAVAAGNNITYKLLYNDATAMTGGQPLAGPMSVGDITRQVDAEGVGEIVVVTDRPDLYGPDSKLAPGVKVYHRDRLDEIQRRLRKVEGVSLLVYEQTCAAEKRRRRKRGQFPDPPKRMFINEAVCEGCGDCSTQSNCASLFPVETKLGRKRTVDQSTCNKDYSCVKGFCPSFVTVHGGSVRKPEAGGISEDLFANLPLPEIRSDENCAVMLAGIGGTGVVTVGAVLAMAAHIEGRYASSYDMTGMAQKGGAVYSHVRIARSKDALAAQKISTGEADLLIACDLVAGTGGDAYQSLRGEETVIVANTEVVPTAANHLNVDTVLNTGILKKRLTRVVGDQAHFIDASHASMRLLGDTIGSNFFLIGMACQLGALPISPQAIEQAIRLNGVAVDLNLAAFRLGRLCQYDRAAFDAQLAEREPPKRQMVQTLSEIRRHRAELLTDYQNADYAERYERLVELATGAETECVPGEDVLAKAVARGFSKLMAYKDEYEVGRLYSRPEFKEALEAQFGGDYKLAVNLAPPLLARRDHTTGLPRKREFGPWIFPAFRILARLKFLRGTRWDIFGYTKERREERRWVNRYEELIARICEKLTSNNHALAVEIASIPDQIRGYGHIKERHWDAAEDRLTSLLSAFEAKVEIVDTEKAA